VSDTDAPVDPFVPGGRLHLEGVSSGPLAGCRFAVKDLFDVAGCVTGGGNPDWLRTNGPAPRHAPVVAACLAAGATLVGRTHTDELSRGILGRNAHYGTPVNPAAPARLPGGSSSGSAAAVAAGFADFALGTDTGGSVRIPGAFCGLSGLRTTHGRVSLDGVLGQAPSFDTVGWLARDAGLLAQVTEALLGPDAPFERFRLRVAEDAFACAEPATGEALAPAVARLRAEASACEAVTVAREGLAHWRDTQMALQRREAWESFRDWIETVQPRLAWDVALNFRAGAELDPAVHAEAVRVRPALAAAVRELLGDDGLLCLPTAPFPAPPRSVDGRAAVALWPAIAPLTCIAGLAGLPQLTLPVARVGGAPVGLSLIAPAGRDGALAALAARLFRP
jgi:amidase